MRVVWLNILFIIVLLLPPAAIFLPIVPGVKLVNIEKVKKPRIKKFSDFSSGLYQRVVDVWSYQQSDIWSLFVKAQNSLNYRIFNLASEKYSNETLMGNDHVLFDRIYVNDLNGTYISETPEPIQFAEKIRKFQDMLESHGKQFLIVIHPSKTVMNQDWVPDSFRVGQPGARMIDLLEPELRERSVNYIKVSDSFTDKSVRYWPKSGAHLNSLGKCLSARDTLRFFDAKNVKHLSQISCEYSAHHLTPAEGEDLDLVRLINAWGTKRSKSKVPFVKIKKIAKSVSEQKIAEQNKRPTALLVGTSYTFGLLASLRAADAFSETDFLFYNKSWYSTKNIGRTNEQRTKKTFNKNLHSTEFILSHDLVILESTEARLHQLGFGILNATESLKKPKKTKKKHKIV